MKTSRFRRRPKVVQNGESPNVAAAIEGSEMSENIGDQQQLDKSNTVKDQASPAKDRWATAFEKVRSKILADVKKDPTRSGSLEESRDIPENLAKKHGKQLKRNGAFATAESEKLDVTVFVQRSEYQDLISSEGAQQEIEDGMAEADNGADLEGTTNDNMPEIKEPTSKQNDKSEKAKNSSSLGRNIKTSVMKAHQNAAKMTKNIFQQASRRTLLPVVNVTRSVFKRHNESNKSMGMSDKTKEGNQQSTIGESTEVPVVKEIGEKVEDCILELGNDDWTDSSHERWGRIDIISAPNRGESAVRFNDTAANLPEEAAKGELQYKKHEKNQHADTSDTEEEVELPENQLKADIEESEV